VATAGRSFAWPFTEIVQKTGFFPGEPVRFDSGDEILIVEDRAFRDELHTYAPQFGQSVRDPKTRQSDMERPVNP
jgi:hypothetical protein